jgi:hypothetical protein
MWFYAMIIGLLLVLMWLTRVRENFMSYRPTSLENFVVPPGTLLPGGFEVPNVNPGDLPAPQELFKKLRVLIDKYDRPDVWNHATQVMDKDPGQLARTHLGIAN